MTPWRQGEKRAMRANEKKANEKRTTRKKAELKIRAIKKILTPSEPE